MDLMSLLPLLTGNADTSQILQTVLGQGRCEKPHEPQPPPPPSCKPSPCSNYAKLYPDYQHVADLPRCDEPAPKPSRPQPDFAQLLSLFSAMQAHRNAPPAPCGAMPDIECVAPHDIKLSLKTLLDMDALSHHG